jgi:alkaline phosphatase D
MYDRTFRELVRYPHGEKIRDFHVPTTLEDYRAVYRAYLHDPDLQDARARFPFVCIWDNHEFSWLGWQSVQRFGSEVRPAQVRKVAANQAWFEYQPARIAKPTGPSLDRFDPPAVVDTPLDRFDDHGLAQEPNNLAAIGSLTAYRALRFGPHVELFITDQHSYRSEEPSGRPEAAPLSSDDFPDLMPQEALEIFDAGREFNGGRPPDVIQFGDVTVPNFRKDQPPQTILGARQKAWFLERLGASQATWKVWGNSLGTLDWRADPQNLPPGLGTTWPGAGYAGFGGGDWGSAYVERGEIYDFIRTRGITGFAVVAGDRHSFWAGLAAKALPPHPFEPIGISFVTGSISAPGLVEALEHRFPKDHPLRFLYLADRADGSRPEPAVNLLMRHGVQSCLEYRDTGDVEKARARSNAELAPHLRFLDMGGHGYTAVTVTSDAFETEFVCIPRPIKRSERADGGPLRYRVVHRAQLWGAGEAPRLEQRVVEGNPILSL